MIDFVKGVFKELFGSKREPNYEPDDTGDELDLVLGDGSDLEDDNWLVFKSIIIKVGRIHYLYRGPEGNAYVATHERDQQGNPITVDTGEKFDDVSKFMNGD